MITVRKFSPLNIGIAPKWQTDSELQKYTYQASPQLNFLMEIWMSWRDFF